MDSLEKSCHSVNSLGCQSYSDKKKGLPKTKRQREMVALLHKPKGGKQKLKKKSDQDHGIYGLTTGERANKRDDKRADAKRRKMQRESGKSDQDIRRIGKTPRKKTKNKNGREVNVRRRKDQQKSEGKSGQD